MLPAATMMKDLAKPKAIGNIHNALITSGWQMNFDGLRRLTPRQRYIGIQYAQEIREKLKFAKGESGYGTTLAMEKKLEPVGVTQLYPAQLENSWYVALAVPRRKSVYGYENPRPNSGIEIAALMTDLRKSNFHGPDTSDALFYIRESPGYFTRNPHCMSYWSTGRGSWGFVTDGYPEPRPRYPNLAEFIGDDFAEGVFVPYPALETKPKTVNDWDRYAPSPAETERKRGIESLMGLCPWAQDNAIIQAWDLTGERGVEFQDRLSRARQYLEVQYMKSPAPPTFYTTNWYQPRAYTVAVGAARDFFGNAAPAPPPKPKVPPEPEPLSKNGGRFVMLEDPE